MGSDLIIIDAGPLVAMLNSRAQHYRWAINVVKQLDDHLYTTEAVLSEAFFF